MNYRQAKDFVAESVIDPKLAKLCVRMLDRFSGRTKDIRPEFLDRIIQQVTVSQRRTS
jgi:hypothetical protein